ncbi:MAG: CinA family nicotinamide mononucleotide deamidase-related protein [Bacteroidetes bacterium]|nr:CinA family nicotinamide mononucleotide deamidase-related protein [Bacteroidota bacterium]
MKVELIHVGDELLSGQTVNTHTAWSGESLGAIGASVIRATAIADRSDALITALDQVQMDADWVIITGGLGPTNDDITKTVMVDYMKDVLVHQQAIMEHIQALFASLGRKANDMNLEQANFPSKATVLHNPVGTAPGMLWQHQGKFMVNLPGVPFEMKRLMHDHVLPLIAQSVNQWLDRRHFWVHGLPESDLAMRLKDLESSLSESFSLAYLPAKGVVRLQLRCQSDLNEKAVCLEEMEQYAAVIRVALGHWLFSEDESPLAAVVGTLLQAKGQTLSVAESCTGGAVSSAITAIPGSSTYFHGAIVSYANAVKVKTLGVNQADIMMHGAVSRQVVVQMAKGVRKRLGTDWGLASSGIAGPGGGTDNKPVGTVWLAIEGPGLHWSKQMAFGSHRQAIVERSVNALLHELRWALMDEK